MFVTLLADGQGGGWAFHARPDPQPPTVQPAHAIHITVPLCGPATSDPLEAARTTVVLPPATAAALATGAVPHHGDQQRSAVVLVADPAQNMAVTVGVFADTPTAQAWWAQARHRFPATSMTATILAIMTGSDAELAASDRSAG